jgi:hypothetical protein
MLAIWPPGSRTAAKAKTSAPRIAVRPAAVTRSEPDDFFRCGEIRVGESDCLGARRGRLFRRRREEGSGRLRFGAAVSSGGDGDSDLLDPVNRHAATSQEAKDDADAAGGVAIAGTPAPDGPRADAKQLGDAVLCDAEPLERRAEFGSGH